MRFVCAGKSWDKVASSALRHNQQPALIEEFIVQRSSRICSLDPLASWAISFCIPARSNSALQYTPLRLRPPQGDTARLFRTRLTYATNRTRLRLTARPPSSLFSQLPTHFHTRAKGRRTGSAPIALPHRIHSLSRRTFFSTVILPSTSTRPASPASPAFCAPSVFCEPYF